jgi:hypothetical protein
MKKIQTVKNIKKIKNKKHTKLREEIGEFLPYISCGLI